ncbi:Glutamate racemase [Fusobacterium necrogenes]|uniref:Glutamate racemase n=1 Tax=Fusobacterium necrogenes TaxID=858 RepID=A0A377GXZ1_9FUSO|nr:glutamate racemase [Fusobacterium necrogenes]STO31828.1 Glutamate racemase [Fusobacterium necrogenes]
MTNKQSIGIFDSGVGGTTILKEILSILPHENILYYGDSKNSPYGQKNTQEIKDLCYKILDFFMEKNCKVVVIACNTATAAALESLKKRYPIPIIGVINAGVKEALKLTKNKNIAILATPFTVSSRAYIKELTKFSTNILISQEGCPEFSTMIEIGWEKFKNREELLKQHISKLSKEADTLILGCTHYPLIRKDIEKQFSGNIVDPAVETALELFNLLKFNNNLNNSDSSGDLNFFISGDKNSFKIIAEKFLGLKINNIYSI